MAHISRRGFLAMLLLVSLHDTVQAEDRNRANSIRLYYPFISSALNIETLRPVAATPNIPVYEDSAGRRFLAGVDFAPFLHTWLESYLTGLGFSVQSPMLSTAGSASFPSLLLELCDFRIDLTAAEFSYSGTVTLIRPTSETFRQDFKTQRAFGVFEEGSLEPRALISNNFEPLLRSLRNQIADDLENRLAPVKAELAGQPSQATVAQ